MQTPPTRSALRVLLATMRPAVESFVAGLAALSADGLLVESIALEPDRLEGHAETIASAAVAVVDVGLDAAVGREVCERLHRLAPSLPIAALVCCPQAATPWEVHALLTAGVSGVLDLQATAAETLRALESVAAGRSVLHLHLRRGHRGVLREVMTGSGLTETQMRLLGLVARGLPDHEIALRVHLSPHTVKHHIEQLRNRVGARNRTALAAWAGRHGFYSDESDADALVPIRIARPS